jgi:uncharacterized membrane-anchored protein
MVTLRRTWTTLALLALAVAPSAARAAAATQAQAEAIEKTLIYQTGTLTVHDASIAMPSGARFLTSQDAQRVMHDMYGNPPDPELLGLIVPDGQTAMTADYVVTVAYDDSGHISDKDASGINYADMLRQLQKQAADDNPSRVQQGYDALTVVGWAEQPHYDAVTHKLYWARELEVGNDPVHTLNYGVRVLGREGTLDLDAISSIENLSAVSTSMNELLQSSAFAPGRTYADYKHGDRTSSLTIAALIAGGTYAAAKTGLIALLLAKAKFIIVAIIATIGALRRRIMRRFRGGQEAAPVTAPEPMTVPEPEPMAVSAAEPPAPRGLGIPAPEQPPDA